MSRAGSTADDIIAYGSSNCSFSCQPTDSITQLLKSLRNGNEDAVSKLWDLYFSRLVGLARKQLGKNRCDVRDEEDLALSAFKSIFTGVKKNHISRDMDRESLWKFMATVTLRKVYDFIAYRRRQKRNPTNQPGAIRVNIDDSDVKRFLVSSEINGELAIEFDEYFESLMSKLPKLELRQIVSLKLEGYSNREIAGQLGRGLSSIERKLKTIRSIWNDELNL